VAVVVRHVGAGPELPVLPGVPRFRIESHAGVVMLQARWPDLRPALGWSLRVSCLLFVGYVVVDQAAAVLGLFVAPLLLLLGRAYAKGVGAFQGHVYHPLPRRITITPRTSTDRYREACSGPSLVVDGREVPREGLRLQVTQIESVREDRFAVSLVGAGSVLRLCRFEDEYAVRRFVKALADLLELAPPPEPSTEVGVALAESHAPTFYLLLAGAGVIAFEWTILAVGGHTLLSRSLVAVLFLAFAEILLDGLLWLSRSEVRKAAIRTFDLLRLR